MPKLDEVGREGEKEILVPNSVCTQPGRKIPKKIPKKFKKITKPLSDIIFSQNGNEIGRKIENKKF